MINYLANPNRFLKFSKVIQPLLGYSSLILITIGLYFSLLDSPVDYQQGHTVRIMYVHVPSAWLASILYFAMAGCAAIFLIWKHPLADISARCIAPIGLIFSLLTLITGSLWGKPMWGTWWVWDARLTSMLILTIFYISYIGLANAFESETDGSKPASVLSILGAINLPIIKFSVDWWNTLHQPSSILRMDGPSISNEMMLPLMLMLIGFFCLATYIIIVNIKIKLMIKKHKKEMIRLSQKNV